MIPGHGAPAQDELGNPITQGRWEKVLCQLEEACTKERERNEERENEYIKINAELHREIKRLTNCLSDEQTLRAKVEQDLSDHKAYIGGLREACESHRRTNAKLRDALDDPPIDIIEKVLRSHGPDLVLLTRALRCGENTPYAKLLEVAEGLVRRATQAEEREKQLLAPPRASANIERWAVSVADQQRDEARRCLREACEGIAVHGEQPPAHWLAALERQGTPPCCSYAGQSTEALLIARRVLVRWEELYAEWSNANGHLAQLFDRRLPPADHVKALEAIGAALSKNTTAPEPEPCPICGEGKLAAFHYSRCTHCDSETANVAQLDANSAAWKAAGGKRKLPSELNGVRTAKPWSEQSIQERAVSLLRSARQEIPSVSGETAALCGQIDATLAIIDAVHSQGNSA